MRPLSAWELLNLWEWGQALSPLERALGLLSAACPDASPDTLAALSIGERDAQLLTLREWTFGPRLESVIGCPACGERLELRFQVADLRAPAAEMPSEAEPCETFTLEAGDYRVEFRLPNSLDMSRLAHGSDLAASRRQLLRSCILSARCSDAQADCDRLPDEVTDAIVQRMAEADPQADVQLDVSCPACDHGWQVAFDIVFFLWHELDAWARHTLSHVHTLASAYGWREADILAMSQQRRHYYLQMVTRS